jgi:hypothetical protein
MYDWIYKHFINSYWFILFGLSLPSMLGVYFLYVMWKDMKPENQNDEQDQEGTQQQN